MILKRIAILCMVAFYGFKSLGQCGPGQSPGAAFPVCGTATFDQTTVPLCNGRNIPTPGCSGLQDINAYWYQFKCFSSGSLGFLITPNTQSDDYDWQLFDITNRNPADVYSDVSLFVACNWSGAPGNTGAAASGNKLTTCGSLSGPPYESAYSSMPDLVEGHTYILMVSHFSGSDQSGYALSFGGANGGTAVITDSTLPGLKSARAICDGIKMTVKLTKRMKCNSVNPDGSDFSITPTSVPIIAAEPANCENGFDMDSVLITLGAPVQPGNYTISVRPDNLLDNCNNPIPAGASLPVTVFPLTPTPMDSLTNIGCAPNELELVFNKPMSCSSIAADGSDFFVTGPGNPTVAGAAGICNGDGLSNSIRVKLSSPIQVAGNYRINLRVGSDGNTVLNECGKETAAGSFINFTSVDTVSALFNVTTRLGCITDVIDYSHDGRNRVNYWKWTFDNSISSNAKDTSLSYTVFGNKTAQLIVSNGVCSDTSAVVNVLLDNELSASFESTPIVCPEDPALFVDRSFKHVTGWQWTFGNGSTSTEQAPPPQYYPAANDNSIKDLPVRLIVTNDIGCSDTAVNTIRVVGNCFIAVPTAFTPNGDGLNDFLSPTNAYKAKDLYFAVYNRKGNKVFETRDWTNKWDGTYKSNPQDPGTYVWFLQYTHIETGVRYNLKGTSILLR